MSRNHFGYERLRDAAYLVRGQPFTAEQFMRALGSSHNGRSAVLDAVEAGLIQDTGEVVHTGKRGRPPKLYEFVKPTAPSPKERAREERRKGYQRSAAAIADTDRKAVQAISSPDSRKLAEAALENGFKPTLGAKHVTLKRGQRVLTFSRRSGKDSARRGRATKNMRAAAKREGVV